MKRYVMLEDKEIVDTKDMISYIATDISKQSDNLLDLLEVGDIVERFTGWLAYLSDDFDVSYYKEKMKEYPERFTAIWKRNGDIMRRYELC